VYSTCLFLKHNDAGHKTDRFSSPKTHCLVIFVDGQACAIE